MRQNCNENKYECWQDTHIYYSKCVINCCCMSFEWVSEGWTLGKGLGWKGGKTNMRTIMEYINLSKDFEEHPPAERMWARFCITRASPACSPAHLMFTEYLEFLNELNIQSSHNTKPELNLWLMECLSANLQIIKKKITSKYTTFFFRNTDSSMSPVKEGPSSTDTAFCQHWAGAWVQRSHLFILTTLWNLTGSYARLVGEVFRAGEG